MSRPQRRGKTPTQGSAPSACSAAASGASHTEQADGYSRRAVQRLRRRESSKIVNPTLCESSQPVAPAAPAAVGSSERLGGPLRLAQPGLNRISSPGNHAPSATALPLSTPLVPLPRSRTLCPPRLRALIDGGLRLSPDRVFQPLPCPWLRRLLPEPASAFTGETPL